jgi:4-carboxymuconolactone decarboxylase
MRFPPIKSEELTQRQQQVAEAIATRRIGGIEGIYAPLLYSPEVADLAQLLGEYLRFNLRVPERLRVLAVLVAISRYDGTVIEHLLRTISSGDEPFPESEIQALARGEPPVGMSADEAMVFDFCTQLVNTGRVKNATFDPLARRLGREVCLELVVLCGYTAFATLLQNVTEGPLAKDRANIL